MLSLIARRRSEYSDCACHENDQLVVSDVDSRGFITEVECKRCGKPTETVYNDVSWTYEKIYDKRVLKGGDHICWHRPYAIWHHAIVSKDVDESGEIDIIHYASVMKVEYSTVADVTGCKCCSGCIGEECNSLYRINYEDCYANEYTVMRAKKLRGEMRYDLLERNCEHFSRWCKTGSTTSSQISVFWTSLGKMLLAVGLKALGLLVVFGLLYAHETQEKETKNRAWLEKVQNRLLSVYIAVMTVVFIFYLLKTSGSRLRRAVRRKGQRCCLCFTDDVESQCCLVCRPKEKSRFVTRLCYCLFMCCCGSIVGLLCCVCNHVRCCPLVCCGRQGHLACGLFTRVFTRELVAAAGTLMIVLHEELITNADGISQVSPFYRTSMLVFLALGAHIVGYIVGAFLGRLFEAIWYLCSRVCCDTRQDRVPIEFPEPSPSTLHFNF